MEDFKEIFNQEGTPEIPEELKEALGLDEADVVAYAEVDDVVPEVTEETTEEVEDEDLVVDEVETEVAEQE